MAEFLVSKYAVSILFFFFKYVVYERKSMCERECVCMCLYVRESACMCVCVCVWERMCMCADHVDRDSRKRKPPEPVRWHLWPRTPMALRTQRILQLSCHIAVLLGPSVHNDDPLRPYNSLIKWGCIILYGSPSKSVLKIAKMILKGCLVEQLLLQETAKHICEWRHLCSFWYK